MAKNSCQKKPKFLEILGTKVVQFWCYTKLIKTKKLLLNWYFSTKKILERFEWFLTLKIDFENQILALFDGYFWPFYKSHEKINTIFVISAIMASIWNVFIKFCWHDEKLTKVTLYVSFRDSNFWTSRFFEIFGFSESHSPPLCIPIIIN